MISFQKSTPKYITLKDVAPARIHIGKQWNTLTRHNPKDTGTLVGVPNPYIIPAFDADNEFDFQELYYWDSYFIIQGLLVPEYKDLVIGIVENFAYLFQRFGVMPNASRTYLMGRSQPPFFTSMVWDTHKAFGCSDAWLKRMMAVAEEEYNTVWMGVKKPHARKVHNGMSRYYDINVLHDLAEAESGWDMTPRFRRRALEYLPVDLNALLYKYEVDIARFYRHIGDVRTAGTWEAQARHRKEVFEQLFWHPQKRWYYDYNYREEKQSTVTSLAGIYPMWAGMVDENRAQQLRQTLNKFTQRGGLSATDTYTLNQRMPLGAMPLQWAYPNGWAPLQFLAAEGLRRYGFWQDAHTVAMTWLRGNLNWFNQTGEFIEKYNVVEPRHEPVDGVYPTQVGFGWSNAIFERFCQDYLDS